MNYEQMSDFEINKVVAEALDFEVTHVNTDYSLVVIESDDGEEVFFDPCNNPADAWSVIVENKIGLTPSFCGTFWEADNCYFYRHTNPLRAAMIVFLMMQEGDQDAG